MKLSFDYYHNLEETEFYLCNPDGRELFPLVASDRVVTLRFNDLSSLTFNYYATTSTSDGSVVPVAAYDYVQTRRLIFVTNIGWFTIRNVSENDNGTTKYKSVTCESLQTGFKDIGFYCEERVYSFYNSDDPKDITYDASNTASVPSVVGQLYQQLGIQQDLSQGIADPSIPYSDWTITYINESVRSLARNFTQSTGYAYDWMVNDVEKAFEVVFLFDFYNKTIHIMLPSEITQKANVLYSFSNFMQDITVEESAENIVTVLNCNGNNCDITGVNPTGTNYICDFSYYRDTAGKWMSSALKSKLGQWDSAVTAAKPQYEAKVIELRTAYGNLTSANSTLQEVSTIYTDLMTAVANKSVAMSEGAAEPTGAVWCETVKVNERSMDPESKFQYNTFNLSTTITAYKDPPAYSTSSNAWVFSGAYITGTVEYCYSYVTAGNERYLYFADNAVPSQRLSSYCMLKGEAKITLGTGDIPQTEYVCSGFGRYTNFGRAAYWATLYDAKKASLTTQKETLEAAVETKKAELRTISDSVNILKYFADFPSLLKELRCYWIEGEYTNENIAVTDSTTQEERISLENELLESGKVEIAKVCQPKYQFTLTSADCTKLYEFRDQMRELELGRIVTVEKEEGVWFYPALLSMEYDLDHSSTFNLQFANSTKLDDWGFTYGDLITEASSTSREVSANWQNLLSYSKDKPELKELVENPLSPTLRAAFANIKNQEFVVDETGILGKRFVDSDHDSFADEQMRITNNVILFTDDNWSSVKTALGKITYEDPTTHEETTAYGLIGETIIGSLLLGNKLNISNSDSSIILDANGLTIKKISGGKETVVMHADTQGNLTIKGTIYADTGDIGNWHIVNGSLQSDILGGHAAAGIRLSTDELYLYSSDGYLSLSGSQLQMQENRAQSDPVPNTKVTFNTSGLSLDLIGSWGESSSSDRLFTIGYAGNTYIEYKARRASASSATISASLKGTWNYGTSGAIYASSRTAKKNIQSFDDRYDVLFDELIPRTFLYKNNESERRHYGFILDELKDAMDKANITSQECGAYCLTDINVPDGDGGIRYAEFISLNTWQIQKLKQRVAELEIIVAELQQRI